MGGFLGTYDIEDVRITLNGEDLYGFDQGELFKLDGDTGEISCRFQIFSNVLGVINRAGLNLITLSYGGKIIDEFYFNDWSYSLIINQELPIMRFTLKTNN